MRDHDRETIREAIELLREIKRLPDDAHYPHAALGRLTGLLRRRGYHLVHFTDLDALRGRMYQIQADGEAMRTR